MNIVINASLQRRVVINQASASQKQINQPGPAVTQVVLPNIIGLSDTVASYISSKCVAGLLYMDGGSF